MLYLGAAHLRSNHARRALAHARQHSVDFTEIAEETNSFSPPILAAAVVAGNDLTPGTEGVREIRLRVDAADGFPEEGDGFTGFDLDTGFLHELFEVEVGFKAEPVAKGGVEFFDCSKEGVFALEMIEKN